MILCMQPTEINMCHFTLKLGVDYTDTGGSYRIQGQDGSQASELENSQDSVVFSLRPLSAFLNI